MNNATDENLTMFAPVLNKQLRAVVSDTLLLKKTNVYYLNLILLTLG